MIALAAPAVGTAAKDKPKKPNLAVKKLFPPPAKATAGDSFEAGGRLVNGGERRGRATVKLTLRTELKGDPLVELGKIKTRVPANKKKNFSGDVTIPADFVPPEVPVGGYYEQASLTLVACVRKRGTSGRHRCRAAKSPIEVEPLPDPPTTPPTYTEGERTLGDRLLPQLGNGGYDARHYEIDLDYDPGRNLFEAATTTIEATATQNLSEFSLDFQDLDVSSVTVNGAPANFSQVDAEPVLTTDPGETQPMKLVVTPASGLLEGSNFTVVVEYAGQPQEIIDPDGSSEGWIPACYTPPAGPPEVCDSYFVVGEPMGANGWFPSNNYPTDKATFTTAITVPDTTEAFGAGELAGGAPEDNGDGTQTWTWVEDDPTATYLVTATNGDFNYSETTAAEALTARTLPIYNAIDPSATPGEVANLDALTARNSEMIDFLGERFGPYPFDSYGAIFDNAPDVGYALEVQGKSHFDSVAPSTSTYLHELAHQWFGNAVTLERWTDIWFNEGWARFSEWEFNFETGASATSPAQQFLNNYNSGPASKWGVAPTELNDDPALLFSGFPTYTRGGMTIEGYREIVGDNTFFEFAKDLQSDFAYGNISTAEFIERAKDASGFTGSDLLQLDRYFDQWLYGTVKPTLTPADF